MILLIGPMGAGKSTIGRRLAARLKLPCVDLDRVIVERAGQSIPRIFETKGERAFRSLEEDCLEELCTDGEDKVLATGGGVVLSEANRRQLKQVGRVVWLDAPPEVLAKRIAGDANRPLLRGVNPLQKARELDEQRRPLYEACADYRVPTGQMHVRQALENILTWMEHEQKS